MEPFLLLAVALGLSLLLEAFFSGSEIAFISASRPKIFRLAKDKLKSALLVKKLLAMPETLFSTTVVGTTLTMSFATTYATLFILEHYGESYEWLNLVILTPIILIFGEFVPKMFARSNADSLVLKISPLVQLASFILFPFTKGLSLYAKILKYIFGENPHKGFFLSREEIKAALPASMGSDVTASERRLVQRILEFQKTTVKEMLRPLIDVVALEDNKTLADAVQLVSQSGHSRIPIYRERVDKIVGILEGYDVLHEKDLTQSVQSIMKAPYFIPDSMPLDELLGELKTKPMAIAVNEYGGAEGIITMEDVVEEIVGEIEDEYDAPPKLYHRVGENSFIVNARMEIDAIREELNIPIPINDEEYQTLAGFLLKKMQKIPNKWDSIVIDGIEYVVQTATDRSVEEVYLIIHELPREQPKEEAEE